MDQRSDDIRQDIESTRASLDQKLDTLETKARQTFDVKHQVSERPWVMLGAAVATGYVLGSLGGSEPDQRWHGQPYTTTDYNQHAGTADDRQYTQPNQASHSSTRSAADSFLSQFDDEIDMLKVAAINMVTNFIRDSIKEYVPALGQELDKQSYQDGQRRSGTVSTAPGASTYADRERGSSSINSESIPTTTSYGSNMADRQAEHAAPYYPPGSSSTERQRSVGKGSTSY
jgi:hypothetical protein